MTPNPGEDASSVFRKPPSNSKQQSATDQPSRRNLTSSQKSASINPTSYIAARLLPGEHVLCQANLSWIPLLPIPLLLLLLALLSLFLSFGLFVVLFLLASLAEFAAYIRYSTSEFALTDRRVLVKRGWFRQESVEILLAKIESVVVEQGIEGRMFNYGTLVFRGTGGTPTPLRAIASPFDFYNRVQSQIAATQKIAGA